MLYSYRLLANMKAIISHGYKKFSKILVYILLGLCLSANRTIAHDNVLVIHSYSSELSSVEQESVAIEQGFAETEAQNNIFHEFLDSKLHPRLERKQEFIDYLDRKYQRIPIDLIMVVDEPSLQLMLRQHDRVFPNVPVVFLCIDRLRQELLDTPWLTGVIQKNSVVDTVIEATKQMWTNSIIIINGATNKARANLEQIEGLEIDGKPLNVEIINDLAIEHIKARLNKYPDRVPVLLLGQLRQNHYSTDLVDPSEDSDIIQQQIPNPVYTDNAIRIGKGVVGGKVSDVDYHVRQAVTLGQEILNGARPDEVGPISTGKSRWIFDYRQLLKYNIKLDLLPEDSELLYVEQPIYLKYQTLIVVVASILFACLIAIVLLIEKARKRELTNKILQADRLRYKDLAKAGANVFWELDRELKYSYIFGDFQNLCGLEPAQMKGNYPPHLHRNNSKLNVDWELFERITQARQPLKNFIYSLRDSNDEIRIFKVNGNPLLDRDYNFLGYRGVKQEITAEQNLYRKIAYQATHDDLTGLLNRREFNEKLKRSIQNQQQHQIKSVLCYLDLDRFKIVNDTAGHSVGDRLLLELTQLLQNMIRKEDTLGRLGGDEFGLLLERCSITEAEQIAEQLIRAINNYRLRWKNIEFNVGVSIGMVEILGITESPAELLNRADLACYQAKNLGRGQVYVELNKEPEVLQQASMGHLANVSQAIEENRLYLVKQLIKPIVDEDGQKQHYELLLRLKDRSGNSVALSEFIPVAERYGVITMVDRWVLKTALESYAEHFGTAQTLVSINLSAASINDQRFTDFAIDLIKKSEIPGDCLCFEITETAVIAQINQAQKFIDALKNLGVKFALDDFGSGLSSLSYLKNLQIDYLKIDGSLIKAIPDDEYNRVIVNSINEVAHVMGIKTIAEFVENDRILEYLNEISIDYVQGFVTGKPIAIAS